MSTAVITFGAPEARGYNRPPRLRVTGGLEMVEPSNERGLDGTTISLLLRARGGEEAALNALCTRYQPRLRRWAHGRLPAWARDGVDTEDLVQDAMMKVMARIDTFDPHHAGALQAYLHTILRNRITDIIRAARKHAGVSRLEDDHEDPAPGPLREAIGRERYVKYSRALGRLSEVERGLIVMRFEWGFSHDEIARETAKASPDAARMAVQRALLKLGEEMARD